MLLTERFLEIIADRPARPVKPSPVDRRRAVRAAAWLDEHATSQVSLDDAAAQAGLSAFHFLRVFANVFGVTPHQYLVAARLRRAAARLARTDEPITSIAYAVGFNDLSNFVRTFRAAAGVTPRAFRQGQAAAAGGSA
jgi:AraC-like DNA-binding protein